MRNKSWVALSTAAVAWALGSTSAANAGTVYDYTPSGNADTWGTATNWSLPSGTGATTTFAPGAVPTTADQAQFSYYGLIANSGVSATGSFTIDLGGTTQSVGSIAFRSDAANGTLASPNDLTINNGTFATSVATAFVYQSGNLVTFNSAVSLGAATSTLQIGGVTTKGIVLNGDLYGKNIAVTHLANTGGKLVINGNVHNTGTFAIADYATTRHNSVYINGSILGTGAVTVGQGDVLGGTGIINGPVTVNSDTTNAAGTDGTIAPGNGSAGNAATLTLAGLNLASANDQLNFDLGTAGGSDQIAVNGNVTLNGVLNITQGANFGVGTYPLITYTGTLSGGLASVTPDSTANYVYSLLNVPGAVELVVTPAALPEPAMITLFGCIGVGFLRRRAR